MHHLGRCREAPASCDSNVCCPVSSMCPYQAIPGLAWPAQGVLVGRRARRTAMPPGLLKLAICSLARRYHAAAAAGFAQVVGTWGVSEGSNATEAPRISQWEPGPGIGRGTMPLLLLLLVGAVWGQESHRGCSSWPCAAWPRRHAAAAMTTAAAAGAGLWKACGKELGL